ncbi:MAG: SDR family NAD(P)-dependent oxidoreductase [Rhodospirillales bacterium]
MSEFEGKVALVTGGASGIGEATVRAFAARGGAVVIADIAVGAGEALAAELRGAGLATEFAPVDATSEVQVSALMTHIAKRYGRLDFAHNNVGLGETGVTIETTTLERWDWTLDLSLKKHVAVHEIRNSADARLWWRGDRQYRFHGGGARDVRGIACVFRREGRGHSSDDVCGRGVCQGKYPGKLRLAGAYGDTANRQHALAGIAARNRGGTATYRAGGDTGRDRRGGVVSLF